MPWKTTLAWLWTTGILVACSLPGQSLPDITLFRFDKLIHFALFAGFGWLWMAALRQPLARRAGVVLAAGLAYAVLTEPYQGLLPFERAPDPYDALANALGLGAGVLAFRLLRKRSATEAG
jgi:VanZ family protein